MNAVAVAVVFAVSGQAMAQTRLSERMTALAQRLAGVEGQMNRDDREQLEHHLDRIEQQLRMFQGPGGGAPVAGGAAGGPVSLTCLSNGQQGSYERFKLSDLSTGAALDKGSMLATCKQLAAVQNANLVCTTNGEQGSYERFGLFDLAKKQPIKGFTSLKSCLSLVSGARGSVVCTSNGEQGSYEKFHLFNRDSGKVLGGDTTLEQCQGAIPNP
jgi:hypothetical protein